MISNKFTKIFTTYSKAALILINRKIFLKTDVIFTRKELESSNLTCPVPKIGLSSNQTKNKTKHNTSNGTNTCPAVPQRYSRSRD
jgi:hypothetical protein